MYKCLLASWSNMINTTLVAGVAMLCLLAVSSCSLFEDDGMFRNKGKDYLLSEEKPYIEVPDDLDGDAVGELYRIPEIPETSVLEDIAGTPRPQLLSTNVLEEEVKIQSVTGGRWVLINRLPGEVWPRVRSILNRNAVPTALVNATTGVIETVWLEFKDDSEQNHRYRFTIEQGVQPKSTEISILHVSMNKEADIPPWPTGSDDEEREKTMLNVLASALAGDASSGTVSMLAQQIGGESKVDIMTPREQTPYMLLRLDFDRSRASVGYSVSKDNFSILDQDRTAGIFYLHQKSDEDDDEPGFIRRMLGAEAADKVPEVDYQLRVLRGEDGIEVRIFDAEQGDLERVESLRLLKKIRANLS